MNRACLAVLLVAASSQVASAGYLGIGIGTSPAVKSDAPAVDALPEGSRSVRVLGGLRFGHVSIEAAMHGFELSTYDAYQGSLAGKLSLPLGSGFEAFGRVGVQRTWMTADNELYDVEGNGYLLGGGFEWRLPLAVTQVSIWVDYQFNTADLEGDRDAFELSSRMWTLGVSIGI